ncbi:MAG: hypothetical protein IT334_03230 [Thermomicrobiales bacterium]|nr:hypothetical protein [Thermomicrobiales bacterium]
MSRLSRRSLLAGAAGASALAALNGFTPARLVRAQGAAYEIVSFGPITEGVQPEGDYVPNFGGISNISGGGTGYGWLAASKEKLTPTLFMPDGTMSKMKSGTYGGVVRGVNAGGHAVGNVFENVEGLPGEKDTGARPALWIDGELTRLPLPDPSDEYVSIGGLTLGISDDGAILGRASGNSVLWIDEEPNVLPATSANEENFEYQRITPAGGLFGRASGYNDDTEEFEYQYGIIEDGVMSAVDLPDFITGNGFFSAVMNSAGEFMFVVTPTDLPFIVIATPGAETIEVDHRSEGIYFFANAFNANHDFVGSYQRRAGDDARTTLLRDGEFMPIEDMLPAGHGYHRIFANGISDDGIISGSAYDEDGGFHPLLFVPA